MAAPSPSLLYLLGGNAAASLTNQGSDTGSPAATFVNNSLANISDAVSYNASSAMLHATNSLDTKYAPNTSFAIATMVRFSQAATYQAIWGVKKTSPAVSYLAGFNRRDVGPVMWENLPGGVLGMTEDGWVPVGLIWTAPSTVQLVMPGRINRVMTQTWTSANNITTNDATGKIIFGGAGWGSYTACEFAECSVFKTPPTTLEMREYLEVMRARSVSRGLSVF